MKRPETHGMAKLSHAGKVLTITVKGKATAYTVEFLVTDRRVAHPAIRLTKGDGTSYDIHHDKHGWHCQCPSQVFVEDKMGRLCKHLRACRNVGLIKEPQTIEGKVSQ